jgi:hypothetical protein
MCDLTVPGIILKSIRSKCWKACPPVPNYSYYLLGPPVVMAAVQQPTVTHFFIKFFYISGRMDEFVLLFTHHQKYTLCPQSTCFFTHECLHPLSMCLSPIIRAMHLYPRSTCFSPTIRDVRLHLIQCVFCTSYKPCAYILRQHVFSRSQK